MAVSQSLTLTQVSQNQASNSSVVRILWKSSQTGDSWNGYTRTAKYYVSINGGAEEEYSVSYTLPKASTKTIVDVSIAVKHTSTGAGSIKVRTWMDTNISAGVVTKSASLTLTPIALKSTLAASNGTLGTAQALSVTRKNSDFTHTITYECGTASGTICTKSGSTSINWTPPLALASQNKTGTSVSVTFTITTYNGSTSVGSSTATISCAIPISVKPSCSVALNDSTGLADTYGAPVQGLSKIKISVTAEMAYDSPIASYSIDANGVKYTSSTATTGFLADSGEFKVVATVKDQRGRSSSATATLDVLAYTSPKISALAVHRCDEDGTENDQGEYVQITFSAEIAELSGLNKAAYVLRYKKTTDTDYTELALSELADVYVLKNQDCVIAADSNSSYDVEITATDNHGTATRATSASTAFTLLNFHPGGTAASFGKVCERENGFEWGTPTYDQNGYEIKGLQAIFEAIYPVGSIVIRYDHTDPATLFGGTWKRLMGTFLYGIGQGGDIGKTGGGTLGKALGVTGASFGGVQSTGGEYIARVVVTEYGNENSNSSYCNLDSMGINTLPPYTTVSIWRRTA